MALRPISVRCSGPKRKSAGTSRAGQARRRARVKVEGNMARTYGTGRTRRRSKEDREVASRMLAALQAGADLRTRKVRRLKAAIKVRAYENDLKFEIAVERM